MQQNEYFLFSIYTYRSNSFLTLYLNDKSSSQIYYYYRRPIKDPSETYQRPIGDRHVWSETDMPDWRPVGDRLAWSVTHRRPTCLFGYQRASSETYWHASFETDMPHSRPACLIGDHHVSSDIEIPDKIPIGDCHVGSEKEVLINQCLMCILLQVVWILQLLRSFQRRLSSWRQF